MSNQAPSDDRWRTEEYETLCDEALSAKFPDEQRVLEPQGTSSFRLVFHNPASYRLFLDSDIYSCAKAFVEGRIDILGDPIAAVAFKMAYPGRWFRRWSGAVFASLASLKPESWLQSRSRAKENIKFHYDRNHDFYASFLDARMVYSCAYFRRPDMSLEDAQEQKLDLICRKLDIREGERFLDVGCGWGALVLHAAQHYGAISTGCTLSDSQANYVGAIGRTLGFGHKITVQHSDFRDLDGQYDKIASVGMFEHVGRRRLSTYFSKIHGLLAADGLFLNHGIVRPEGIGNGLETLFLRKYVFPGGELTHLSEVIKIAGKCGFEVLDVENLRPHYAITCRRWVERLIQNKERCIASAGPQTYRVWLLYLSASALSFEQGKTDVYQVLMAKRSGKVRRLTRDYMF
jgi:cyclopropane-fatty-acyl-phospholipid synthase